MIDKDKIDTSTYHDELAENLVQRIKRFKGVFNEVCPRSLEEWIDGFRGDMHPEREIAIWEKMAEIFGQLCKKRRAGNEVERKQIFREVLERSLKGEPTGVSEKKSPRHKYRQLRFPKCHRTMYPFPAYSGRLSARSKWSTLSNRTMEIRCGESSCQRG